MKFLFLNVLLFSQSLAWTISQIRQQNLESLLNKRNSINFPKSDRVEAEKDSKAPGKTGISSDKLDEMIDAMNGLNKKFGKLNPDGSSRSLLHSNSSSLSKFD